MDSQEVADGFSADSAACDKRGAVEEVTQETTRSTPTSAHTEDGVDTMTR